MSKSARRALVISYLKEFSLRNQINLLTYFESKIIQNKASNITQFWIINAVSCKAISSVIREIAERVEVEYVDLDEPQYVGLENKKQETASPLVKPVPVDVRSEILWTVEKIRAPEVWNQGYTGQDIIVAVLGTGVNYDHSDLKDHIWTNSDEIPNNGIDDDHNGYIDDYYGFDFYNQDSDPKDENGHDTHVAGWIAGDGTEGIQTGVAPDARVMSLKIADGNNATESATWNAIQYAVGVEKADVINLSHGWLNHPNPLPPEKKGHGDLAVIVP